MQMSAHWGNIRKEREKALCSDSLRQAPPFLSSTGPDDTSRRHRHAELLIPLVLWLVFPNWPVSLHWECVQETDTINTVGNVNMSIFGLAIKAHLHSSKTKALWF